MKVIIWIVWLTGCAVWAAIIVFGVAVLVKTVDKVIAKYREKR